MASMIKNTVDDSRQCITESTSGRKKAKKSGTHVASPGTSCMTPEKLDRKIERKEFQLTALTTDDAEDLGGKISTFL